MDKNEVTETLEDLIIKVQRLEKRVAQVDTAQTALKAEHTALENRISALEQTA